MPITFIKTSLLCLLLTLCLQPATAQLERMRAGHWYFGDGYGFDFTSGKIQKEEGAAIQTIESCCAMSDKNGQLLFYTNGGGRSDGSGDGQVWNANHEVMEGGDFGGLIGGGKSAWQGCLIVPNPVDENIYYLFTIDELETYLIEDPNFPIGKGFSAFEINISANNGKGKVTIIGQNITTPSFEYLTGTQHANCTDYWVIIQTGHHFIETNADALDSFYVFKVDETGLNTPVISPIFKGFEELRDEYGAMKMTTDGEQLVAGTFIYDFNKETGQLTNPVDLKPAIRTSRDPVAISPDNQFLYNFKVESSGDTAFVFASYQYELGVSNIMETEVKIAEVILEGIFVIGTPQLAPDGKIYIPSWADDPLDKEIISVIHIPNEKGTAAKFELDLLAVSEDFSFRFLRFGNFMDHIFQKKPISEHQENSQLVSVQCEAQEEVILMVPSDKTSYAWSTNTDTDSIAVYRSGTYWIDYATGCDSGTDTFIVDIINDQFQVALPRAKFLLCEGQEMTLTPQPIKDLIFEWQDGTTAASYLIKQPGTYSATAEEGLCIDTDSLRIIEIAPPSIDLGTDTLLCDDPFLYLQAPYSPYYEYEWSNGATTTDFWVFEEGIYSLRISNYCGTTEDAIQIDICPSCEIYVPNAFSPNGDGINDVLQAFKERECTPINFQFSIFNRWGSQVYNSVHIDNSWNGQSDNNQFIEGVYLYQIQYELLWPDGSLRKEVQTGDITLFR